MVRIRLTSFFVKKIAVPGGASPSPTASLLLVPLLFHPLEKLGSVAVVLHDEVEVLVAAAGEVHERGARDAGAGDLDRLREGVAGFDRRDDALMPRQEEERLDGLLVADGLILDSSHLVQERVLRTGGGIIEAAGVGVDRRGVAVFVGEHDAVEAVHDALGAVGDGRRVVAELRASAQRLDADELDRVREKRREHADGVRPAADAGDPTQAMT